MSYTEIEHPDAYENAIKARIQAAGNRKRAASFDAQPDAEALRDFIFRRAAWSNFYSKMADSFAHWGCPSEKMLVIARRDMAENAEKTAARKAERAAQDAASQHVGQIGQRLDLVLTVTFQTSWEGDYGTTYITGFRDEAGNVFVHKGTCPGYDVERAEPGLDRDAAGRAAWVRIDRHDIVKGETVKVKATVKAHGTRDGVAQTIIARPKFSAA